MPDLSPVDLQKGYRLVFQRNPKTNQVRAVIKGADGSVFASGPTVDEGSALQSSRAVLMSPQWLEVLQPAPSNFDEEDEDEDLFDDPADDATDY